MTIFASKLIKSIFSTATAYTIRSLHSGKEGAEAASKKSKMLGWSFLGAFLFKVASGYAPALLYDWHIGWTLYRLGWTSMIHLENYGWYLESMHSSIAVLGDLSDASLFEQSHLLSMALVCFQA